MARSLWRVGGAQRMVVADERARLQYEGREWLEWRRANPSRAHGQRLHFTGRDRPKADDQRPWHVYEQRSEHGKVWQNWLLVPVLLKTDPQIQPLADAPETRLETYKYSLSDGWQHLTTIDRVRHLAKVSPADFARGRTQARQGI